MKILLIYPYFIEERIDAEDITSPPIGLYWVAALLREHGHDVKILNLHAAGEKPDEIRDILSRERPQVVGFSILHANRWGGIEIARIAKEVDPNLKIVFGGPGAAFLWNHLLTHFPQVDYVVIGEGEYTLLRLLQQIEQDNACPESIEGIAFRKEGKIVKTGNGEPIPDLDELPLPAKYFAYQHVSSSRGCNWKCRFCGSPALWNCTTRYRSPGRFVDELELLHRKGINFFYISDDTFTTKKSRVIEICRTIIERDLKITWNAISRVDSVDEEVLYWMRMAGCIQISYGVESGSAKIRAVLNKKIKIPQVKKAFALTRSYGILPRAYFIYGSPGETWETVEETIGLLHEIQPLAAIFYILDLFPGTELYERIRRGGQVTDDIWLNRIEGLLYLETDPRLSDRLVLGFGKRLRAAFYENVHSFAESISLVDKKELYPKHADFCSRLALTFTHGDYARNEMVRDKERVAEKLFRKGLEYAPDERAYLGIGILKQKKGEHGQAMEILSEGVAHFPLSEPLHVCLGISHMALGEYESAISCFSKFPESNQARSYMKACRRESGKIE
ncbi:MAG: B12-binding domain-containing radical SAM protein [Deltaproteobacteria bacterium HGW-Deltaproteobacteria-21]|nr:MAG: B12-binding domain-containing radical SAM protein [Deltaproteobacteria bacterium HGW-Deltaproteobacteria-21]